MPDQKVSILCPKCNKPTDNFLPIGGINLACDCSKCHQLRKPLGKPFDWSPSHIKEGRKEHKKALLQPYRQGDISKEYLDAYPEQARGMVKEGIITQKQANKAKNVWKGVL